MFKQQYSNKIVRGSEIFLEIDIIQNVQQITFPIEGQDYQRLLEVIDGSWNLSVPKEEVDPWDPLNFVMSYPNDDSKLNPVYLSSRNPGEGFYKWDFKGIILKSTNRGAYNDLGTKNGIIAKFKKDFTNLQSYSIVKDSEEQQNVEYIAPGETSIIINPFQIWEKQMYPIWSNNFTEVNTFPAIWERPLFQTFNITPNPLNITQELPITLLSRSIGSSYQPVWNRPLHVKFKLTHL